MKQQKKLLLAIFSTGILSFCGVVVETAMNVTFPQLMKLFNITLSQAQWVTTSYLLVLAAMMPLSAFFKRNFNQKILFIIAALFFLAGVLIDAFAQNLALLILGRLFQGVGTGISLPLMFNIILEQAPKNKLGLLMGLGNFITATAPAIGPVYGGILIDSYSWRMIFILLIPLIIIALISGIFSIPSTAQIAKSNFDFIGWSLTACMFVSLIVTFSFIGKSLVFTFIFLLIGIMSCYFMKKHYLNTPHPVINWKILKDTRFTLHLSSYFIGQFVVLGLSFLVPNLMQLHFHLSSFQAGIAMSPGALLGAIATPFGGALLDHLGAKKPIIYGITLQTIAVLSFILLFQYLSIFVVTIIFIISALGQSLSMSAIMTSALSKINVLDQSDGNALFNTFQQFAGAAGTAIISATVSLSLISSSTIRFYSAFIICLMILVLDLFFVRKIFTKFD